MMGNDTEIGLVHTTKKCCPRGLPYKKRVLRSSSWHVKTKRSTITTRNFRSPAHRSTHYGIRLVRRAK